MRPFVRPLDKGAVLPVLVPFRYFLPIRRQVILPRRKQRSHIIVVIVNIHRHGRKLPGALKELKSNVSEKIESKEQLFYDDSQDDLFRKELREYKEMLEKDGLNKEHSDEASESAQEIKEEKTEHSKNDKSKRKKKSKK